MPIFMTHKALTELGFVCLVIWIAQVRLERMEVEIQLGKIKKDFMFEGTKFFNFSWNWCSVFEWVYYDLLWQVFRIEKLREAIDGFKENSLIEGSVYKCFINRDFFAIQKMKWNTCEELKILQKVFSPNSFVFFSLFLFLNFWVFGKVFIFLCSTPFVDWLTSSLAQLFQFFFIIIILFCFWLWIFEDDLYTRW